MIYSNLELMNNYLQKLDFQGSEKLTHFERKHIANSDNRIKEYIKIMIKRNEEVQKIFEAVESSIVPDIEDRVIDKILTSPEANSELLFTDKVKEITLVSCFSEVKDSIIMWSHYADKHKGFCVEYDLKSMSYPRKDMLLTLLFPVLYQNELFNSTNYLKLENENISKVISVYPAITKSKEWEYEKEWRIVIPSGILKDEMEWIVPLPTAILLELKLNWIIKNLLKNIVVKIKYKCFNLN